MVSRQPKVFAQPAAQKYSEPPRVRLAPAQLNRTQKGWIFPLSGYPALVFRKSLNRLSRNTGGIYLGAGIEDAPDKENGTRINVANQEDEGAVYGDFHSRFRRRCRWHNHCGGSSSLGASFIHGNECLVHNV